MANRKQYMIDLLGRYRQLMNETGDLVTKPEVRRLSYTIATDALHASMELSYANKSDQISTCMRRMSGEEKHAMLAALYCHASWDNFNTEIPKAKIPPYMVKRLLLVVRRNQHIS